jgi:hypothetical protein
MNMKTLNALPLAALIAIIASSSTAFAGGGPVPNGAYLTRGPHTVAVSVNGQGIGHAAKPAKTIRYSPHRSH